MEKKLDEETLVQWVSQIFHDLELIFTKEGFSNTYFRTRFNVTNFLKSLYFRVGFNDNKSRIRDVINNHLKELHEKLYGGSFS